MNDVFPYSTYELYLHSLQTCPFLMQLKHLPYLSNICLRFLTFLTLTVLVFVSFETKSTVHLLPCVHCGPIAQLILMTFWPVTCSCCTLHATRSPVPASVPFMVILSSCNVRCSCSGSFSNSEGTTMAE